MRINEIAARGFSSAAEVYERARPGYAPAAVGWLCERLGLGVGRVVLDLGAGTGKLTRDLVPSGARVIAVEPLHEMRAHLVEAVPEAEALAGMAEAIPLADESMDAVVCGQAFHWFDPERALPEIHRVLRPGGALGLIWNTTWTERHDDVLSVSPLFGAVESRKWPSEQRVSLEGLCDVVASRSYVANLDASAREELLGHIRATFADAEEPLVLRYVVEVFVADRA